MRFDKEKLCFVNDDGSKLEPFVSVVEWSDRKYAKWCRDGIIAAGKEVVDNSWAWKAWDRVWNGHNKQARQWTGV